MGDVPQDAEDIHVWGLNGTLEDGNDIQLNEAHSSMKNDNTVEVSPIDQHR